jgi:hypothetical protein
LQNSHEVFCSRKLLEDVDLYHLLKAQNLKENGMWHRTVCFWNLDLQMKPQEINAAITLRSRFVRFAFMSSREALEKVLDMIVYWGAYGHKNTHPRGKKLLGASSYAPVRVNSHKEKSLDISQNGCTSKFLTTAYVTAYSESRTCSKSGSHTREKRLKIGGWCPLPLGLRC